MESHDHVDVRREGIRLARIVIGVAIGALMAFGMTYLSLWTYYSHPLSRPLVFAGAFVLYFILDFGIYVALGLLLVGSPEEEARQGTAE
jgi:hypothetical protein